MLENKPAGNNNVNLHDLVSQLIIDTKGPPTAGAWLFAPGSSLDLFWPEILVCITIVLVLLARILPSTRRLDSAWVVLAGAIAAFTVAAPWRLLTAPGDIPRVELFTGMLVFDGFTLLMRGILLGFLILFVIFTRLTGVPDRGSRPDIYVLVLGIRLDSA